MAKRGKTNLTYITHEPTRKLTLKKRKMGLTKKLDEITTLCDVKACAILHDPEQKDQSLTLYPNDPSKVLRVISNFKRLSEYDQMRKMLNQDAYLEKRITKATDELKRIRTNERENILTQLMYELLVDTSKSFDGLEVSDLDELDKMIKRYLRKIDSHIDTLKKGATPPMELGQVGANVVNDMNNNINVGGNEVIPNQRFSPPVEMGQVGANVVNDMNNNINVGGNDVIVNQRFSPPVEMGQVGANIVNDMNNNINVGGNDVIINQLFSPPMAMGQVGANVFNDMNNSINVGVNDVMVNQWLFSSNNMPFDGASSSFDGAI